MFSPWTSKAYASVMLIVAVFLAVPFVTRDAYLLHVLILFFLFAGFASS